MAGKQESIQLPSLVYNWVLILQSRDSFSDRSGWGDGLAMANDGLRFSNGQLPHIDFCLGDGSIIELKNPDSLLESGGFDSNAYSQKRNSYLHEIKSLEQEMKETGQELDELQRRKCDEAEFARLVSKADAFKAVAHKIMNLPFSGKQRLLQGVSDGPIAVGYSPRIAHVGGGPEDEMVKILRSRCMRVRHKQPLLLELLGEKHTAKSL